MQSTKTSLRFGQCLLTVMVLAGLNLFAFAADESSSDSDKTAGKSAKKKCMSDVLKGCCDREKRTSQAIAQLMDQLSDASKTDDPAKMKAAIADAKKSLSDMKSDHDKSGDTLKKLHQRLQDLKKQIKAAREDHSKAASMVEDEDMDDVIWAY